MELEWINSIEEAPPCDGHYLVSNKLPTLVGMCYYDGSGFIYEGHYVYPEVWAKTTVLNKKYGKINES